MATELIGDFGLAMGGAAGDELDRLDFELGTPPQALLLASSTGHNHHYQQVIEDIPPAQERRVYGGSTHPPVRADMVYFETARGGGWYSRWGPCPGAAVCPTTTMTTTCPGLPKTF